jgi:5-methylcytosine-specific restriction endonuclease McrA
MVLGVESAAPSRDMHHIVAIKKDPVLRMRRVNWLALCRDCHEAIEGDEVEGMKVKHWSGRNYERALR